MSKKVDEKSDSVQVSSPPCSMHEVDPAYMGLSGTNGGSQPFSSENLAWMAEAVVNSIPDAIVFADVAGVIHFWNGGAERIFGFSSQEAVGQSLDIIIPVRLRQRHWDGYHRMMETGQSNHGPDEMLAVPAITKTGQSLSVQFTVAPVTDRAGALTGIVSLLRDVTATFEELKRLRSGN